MWKQIRCFLFLQARARLLRRTDTGHQRDNSVTVLIEGQNLLYGISVGLWIERQLLFSQIYSNTTNASPATTVSPSRTRTSTTRPALEAFISFCIFIASTTTRPIPGSTTSPSRTNTRTTFPGMSD